MWRVKDDQSIDGPEGLNGLPDPGTFTDQVVDVTPDFNTVIVRHTGHFDYESPYSKDLAAPGAKLMVYFSMYEVDIISNTYQYPYVLEVTYEQLEKPDLAAIQIQATTPLVVNSNSTFQVKFQNGSKPTGPFNVYLYQGTAEWGRWGYTSGASPNQVFTESVTKLLPAAGSLTLTLVVDGDNQVTESREDNNTLSVTFTVNTGTITGDFDVVPSTIQYREPFQLVPKNISGTAGCTYTSHIFRLSKGSTWDSPWQYAPTAAYTFTYPSLYPSPIAAGTVDVMMKLKGSCGESGWISKTLNVSAPSANSPPFFKIGWFHNGDHSSLTPLTKVVLGTKVLARIIEDPLSLPYPSPSDPEQDAITFTGWDFNRSDTWIKGLPARYGFDPGQSYLPNIDTDALGFHTIFATLTDTFGAAYTASSTIEVIPPNPVPVAVCPPTVKENRPISLQSFDASQSYSPMGRTVDHARDEWTNRLTAYTNGTLQDITVQASLHVWDNGTPALKSVTPGTCSITVKPDLVPIGKLDVPPLGIRNQGFDLFNKSYSPDGDFLISATYRYKYDAANDGFTNDSWVTLTGSNLTKASFTPTKVGKYLFDVTVCEDFGKCASASATQLITSLTLDTTNLGPQVSFTVSGKNEQPDMAPPSSYSPSTMLNNWTLTQTNSMSSPILKSWSLKNNMLYGGLGRELEQQQGYSYYYTDPYWGWSSSYSWIYPLNDKGWGPNNLSPYRSIAALDVNSYTAPLLALKADGKYEPVTFTQDAGYGQYTSMKLQTTKTHLFYMRTNAGFGNNAVYAMSKSKMSPAIATQLLAGTEPYIIANGTAWSYRDGNPYDMVLYDGDYKNNPDCTCRSKLVDYAISDTSLLVVFQWMGMDEEGYYRNQSGMEARVYDLKTGQWRGSVGIPSYYPNANTASITTHGDQFRIQTSTDRIITVNGNAQLVSDAYIPRMSTYTINGSTAYGTYPFYCNAVPSNWFKGVNGEYFRYSAFVCQVTGAYPDQETWPNPIYGQDMYLEKLGANLQITWRAKLRGHYWNWGPVGVGSNAFNAIQERWPQMVINPITNEIVVRSFTTNGTPLGWKYDVVNMSSGAVAAFPYAFGLGGANFSIDWQGNYIPSDGNAPPTTVATPIRTIDGRITTDDNAQSVTIHDGNGTALLSWIPKTHAPNGGSLDIKHGAVTYVNAIFDEQYVGDGLLASFYNIGFGTSGGGGPTNDLIVLITKGVPSSNPTVATPYQIGQFQSPFALNNHEISFSLQMEHTNLDQELAGFSFRMQDPMNRYAVETDGTTVYLSRYINGVRTVLQQSPYPFQKQTSYSFKIKTVGQQIEVFVNEVPYFAVSDGSFAGGKIGPFTNKSYVSFGAVSTKEVQLNNVEWMTNYAIWEAGTARAEVRYESIQYADPEGDPRSGSNNWSFTHTPKFMNHQGVSTLDGQSQTGEQLLFDKVGEYWITLRARDDPHPDFRSPSMVFDSYRKQSNAFQQRIIVHRRPIASFTVHLNGDGTLAYTDNSYDPDRWVTASQYSPPDATGINYGTTRGIMERKYYYIAPSGTYVEAKLTRPAETGAYIVGLVVRDEYGAWSSPVTQTISTAVIPVPNTKPTAVLTYPTGTIGTPTMVYTARPTIHWTQLDTPGTVFKGYHVTIRKENGQLVAESGEAAQNTTSSSGSWAVPIDLPIGVKLQAQVRVSDGEDWSTSNIGWLQVNSPPSVVLTYPAGSRSSPTIVQENRRPTIQFVQSDPDPGTLFQGAQLVIRDEWGSVVEQRSYNYSTLANAHQLPVQVDLPTGIPLQVSAQVSDGAAVSEWSITGWMWINSRPEAAVISPTGTFNAPAAGGVRPQLTFRLTDPNPGSTFSQYEIWIGRADGSTVLQELRTGLFSGPDFSYQPDVDLPSGAKLQVRVRGWDQHGLDSFWSPAQWFTTNRPPDADFTWTPNRVWEGDLVTLTNLSSDPDGNPLTYVWDIALPDGTTISSTSVHVSRIFAAPGSYTVKLTVSDGWESDSVTRTILVEALTIIASVHHTSTWLAHHSEKGHETIQPPKDFYSGERFQLVAEVSDAPVQSVKAWIDTIGRDGGSLIAETALTNRVGDGSYLGELFDERFVSAETGLEEGLLPVHFQVIYSNGVVRTQIVPVRIIGSVQEIVGVHRQR
ncbi:PKD domain-containing protein [Paenibacillus koleovorans]|uniref:PKD domain-containing protein n=1 Tax=Paenibacillus koleovorans TaxID=121608 RepID=UPI0013E2A110|nr:PKD domain-containing protein [Paenibacillus koleovorans]